MLIKIPHRFPSLITLIHCASERSGWITKMHVTKAQSLIKAFFQNNLTSLLKLGEELLGHSVSLSFATNLSNSQLIPSPCQ